jgi:hypothetical protein
LILAVDWLWANWKSRGDEWRALNDQEP